MKTLGELGQHWNLLCGSMRMRSIKNIKQYDTICKRKTVKDIMNNWSKEIDWKKNRKIEASKAEISWLLVTIVGEAPKFLGPTLSMLISVKPSYLSYSSIWRDCFRCVLHATCYSYHWPFPIEVTHRCSDVTSRTFPVMYFLQLSHWMPNMAW